MKTESWHRWIAAAGAAVMLLAACGGGGGVDTGGTGAPASYSRGTISGFGSVIVGGVRFDDRSAEVVDDDGTVRRRSDLRLGMSTEIDSTPVVVTAGGSTATASRIRFGSELLGRVDAVDTGAKTLRVIGQTVRVTASTVFDTALPDGLASVSAGSVVEVYARLDAASGTYVATRIDARSSLGEARLRGVITGLDLSRARFTVGSQTVSFLDLDGSTLREILGNGRWVRLRLAPLPVSGVWIATRVEVGVRTPEDRDEARVEGLVTAFTSATRFSVDGVEVDAARAEFPDGSAGIALGARVEVEGALRSGVLVAKEVGIETENETFDLSGAITAVDTAGQSFVLRGVTVRYDAGVEFNGGTIDDLVAGATVEVRGTLSSSGTALLAARIDFD